MNREQLFRDVSLRKLMLVLVACMVAAPAASAEPLLSESFYYSDVVLPDFSVLGGGATSAESIAPAAAPLEVANAVPANMYSWEAVPGVVRNDGSDSFVVKVELPESADSVFLENMSIHFSAASEVSLNDSGQGQDEFAGDNVWTSPALQFNSNYQGDLYLTPDPDSPGGVMFETVGRVVVVRNNEEFDYFGREVNIGLLEAGEPLIVPTTVSATAQASANFVNLKSNNTDDVQNTLRQDSTGQISDLTNEFYQAFGDDYDFLTFLSSHRQLYVNSAASNFNAGLNIGVRNDVLGYGRGEFDSGATYGSAQQLQSILILDNADRGIRSANLMHEVAHRFAAFFDAPETGFKRDWAHWNGWGNVESLLGGNDWIDNFDGSYTIGCNYGYRGVYQMPALERYLFGLQTSENIPTIRFPVEGTPTGCGELMEPGEYHEYSADEVLLGLDTRYPGPAESQKEFRFAFIAATSGRLMTQVEMTFYEKLASWVSKDVPDADPDPFVSISSWVPIERYETAITWRTDIDLPAVSCAEHSATNSSHVSAGRATTEVVGQMCFGTFCFGGTTTYYAVGSNDNLGTSAYTSQVLKETPVGYYALGSCPSGPDTVAPVMTLLGDATMSVSLNGTFVDPGVTAIDDQDGDISTSVTVSGSVNTSVLGIYTLTYNVSDQAGNSAAPVSRTVNVVEGGNCFEMSLGNHAATDRVYIQYSLYYATGTATYLGSTYINASTVVALEEATPGNWSVVNSCN